MKNLTKVSLAAFAALALVSCEKPDAGLEAKLDQLEKQAAEATERQRQLESELAGQRLAAELEAIERERTLIEQERLEMEDERLEQDAALMAELAKREEELAERERRISETRENLDARQQELTGMELELDERELEQAGREPIPSMQTVNNFTAGPPTGDYDNFYEPLAEYGSWFETTDYGYVYQPTVVRDTSWRPYTRGRWAFTDQGWTWVSDEPFGWACYHYGRWTLLRGAGWVWVPGDEWAPAWVTWRESPGHVGWAPLPPETLAWRDRSWDSSVEATFGIGSAWFSFVSYENFGNRIDPYCLPLNRNDSYIRQSTNITRYRIDDHRVFVGGPRYETVCDRIGRRFPVHRLNVDHRPSFRHGASRLNNHFSGGELDVIAPRMDADWNSALRPSRVRRDLGRVQVERSGELPGDVRERFQARRTEENRRAEKAMTDAGGRQELERLRDRRLEENREREPEKRPRNAPFAERKTPAEQSAPSKPSRPDQASRESGKERAEKARRDASVPSVQEPPVVRDSTRRPTREEVEVPRRPDVEGRRDNPGLPPGVIPAPNAQETPRGVDPLRRPDGKGDNNRESRERQAKEEERNAQQEKVRGGQKEEADRAARQGDEAKRRQQSEQKAEESKREAELRKADKDQEERESREREVNRRAQEESQNPQQKDSQDQKDRIRGQEEETRKQEEQQQRLRELQERARQQKEEGGQREQQDRAREQKEQQERVRGQEEARKQEEQQQRVRELQERARQQKEESGQREQQDRAREQKEQQERARLQQEQAREQQERARQQQEQQERARQQKEQQERAREQQERVQQQREQQERARQQQEQQERAREQQERARQQQEQQERAREQQERARQQQEQQERAREQQERARQQQEQQERNQRQREDSERRKGKNE